MHQQSCALRNNIQIYEKCNKRSFENSSARLWVIMKFYHLFHGFWRQWWGCFMFVSCCCCYYFVVQLVSLFFTMSCSAQLRFFYYNLRFPRTIKKCSEKKISSSISCEILPSSIGEKPIKKLSTSEKSERRRTNMKKILWLKITIFCFQLINVYVQTTYYRVKKLF